MGSTGFFQPHGGVFFPTIRPPTWGGSPKKGPPSSRKKGFRARDPQKCFPPHPFDILSSPPNGRVSGRAPFKNLGTNFLGANRGQLWIPLGAPLRAPPPTFPRVPQLIRKGISLSSSHYTFGPTYPNRDLTYPYASSHHAL